MHSAEFHSLQTRGAVSTCPQLPVRPMLHIPSPVQRSHDPGPRLHCSEAGPEVAARSSPKDLPVLAAGMGLFRHGLDLLTFPSMAWMSSERRAPPSVSSWQWVHEVAHGGGVGAESKGLCRREDGPEEGTGPGEGTPTSPPAMASSQPPCLQGCPCNPSCKASRLVFPVNLPT